MFSATLSEVTDSLRRRLREPYLVVENALEPEFAEALRKDLLTTDAWHSNDKSAFTTEEQAQLPSDYSFTREIFAMESPTSPATVRQLLNYLTSQECLQWVSAVSGRLCNGFSGACARYRGNNYLTRHNDYYISHTLNGAVTVRTVTFNYYLTKDWNPDWGGGFVWENPPSHIYPTFNTLVMFLVSQDSFHYVENVSNIATSPRLAITGWFTTTRLPGERKLNLA